MPGQVVRLLGQEQRAYAAGLLRMAPLGSIVEFHDPHRTIEQNNAMWPMLGDIAIARPRGRVLPPPAWKCVFMGALGYEAQTLEGLYPHYAPVAWEGRSSRLPKKAMSDLLTLIRAYGDEHNVKWREPQERKAS